MFDAEFDKPIFARFQALLNFLESVGILVEVFAWAAFADILGFLSGFEALAHIFGHIKKSEVGTVLNISEQWVIKNSFKLFFICQLAMILSLRFFNSLFRLREYAEVIKRAATLNLFLAFQQSGPFVEKRGFRLSVFGQSAIGFIKSQNLLKSGNKTVARRGALFRCGNIRQKWIFKNLFEFLVPVYHCCCASLLRLS